jgi:hypothetical protein
MTAWAERPTLIAGTSRPVLAEAIARALSSPLAGIETRSHPDWEIHVKLASDTFEAWHQRLDSVRDLHGLAEGNLEENSMAGTIDQAVTRKRDDDADPPAKDEQRRAEAERERARRKEPPDQAPGEVPGSPSTD